MVTNFSMSTTPDVLKLYFENKKRSNGGEVEFIDTLLNEVYIEFKNTEGFNWTNSFFFFVNSNFPSYSHNKF